MRLPRKFKSQLIFFVSPCLINVFSTFGISRMPAVKCPDKFTGIAKKVTSSMKTPNGHVSNLEREKVEFQVQEVHRGNLKSKLKKIQYLKGGLVSVKEGEVYEVEMNKGYICRLTRVSEAH